VRCLASRYGPAVESLTTLPLPGDAALARWSSALNDAGYWAYVLDRGWRVAFVTDELRLSHGDTGDSTCVPIGHHWYGVEVSRFWKTAGSGAITSTEMRRALFSDLGPYVLGAEPGGRDALRDIVDGELTDLVDQLEPEDLPPVLLPRRVGMAFGGTRVATRTMYIRINDDEGQLVGVAIVTKPAAGMSQLAAATATADLGHLERMRLVERADRRPAAVLMGDLEASSPLARRLSTAQYFSFGRRLVRAADQCIIDAGGIVGRHAGDGFVAFFLAETAGSESAAARSCVSAARALRDVVDEAARRSEIEGDVAARFALHWGAMLYVGRILTPGRSEVTALGDEVNEAARIEACATGGRTLASKALIERLDRADAQALGLDTDRILYTPLAELPTATDKARRDAPAIAVCDLTGQVTAG
jgi:class 3 adenylate cyclase